MEYWHSMQDNNPQENPQSNTPQSIPTTPSDMSQDTNIQSNTQPDSPLENSPTQPPPKKRNILKIILITLLILFLISAIGFVGLFFYIQQSLKNDDGKKLSEDVLNNPAVQKMAEQLPIPKITMVPITVAPTQEITPGTIQQSSSTQGSTIIGNTQLQPTNQPVLPQEWKKYTNTSLEFSIDYPDQMEFEENSRGLGVWDIYFYSDQTSDIQDIQILVYPVAIGKLIGQDFEQLYSLPDNSTQLMTIEGSDPQQYTKIVNKTVSGLRALDFKTTSDPPDPNVEAESGVVIELDDSILIISTGESDKAILDKMLTTFKYPVN